VLELYGGVGNFTWVLAQHTPSVIMTELSKQAVDAAQHAFQAAGLSHVSIAAMDSEQVSRSLSQTLQGTQLRWQGQDYDIDLVLVDPPRAGLDDTTRQLLSHFTHIIYISCNPDTLARDLLAWQETHDITAVAIFDQFPYTHHIETGVILRKQSIKGSS
jgi:tRNA (uracil-5-)-methyltransferase